MPMVFCKLYDYRHKHREGLLFVVLEDIEEVIVLKKAHGAVCNLQVNATNALDNAFEQLQYHMIDFVYLAYFKHFLQFGQKEGLFNAICKWPVFKKTFKQSNG